MSSPNGDSYTSSILMSVLFIYSFLINFWLEQILSRSGKNGYPYLWEKVFGLLPFYIDIC